MDDLFFRVRSQVLMRWTTPYQLWQLKVFLPSETIQILFNSTLSKYQGSRG